MKVKVIAFLLGFLTCAGLLIYTDVHNTTTEPNVITLAEEISLSEIPPAQEEEMDGCWVDVQE
jgi:hypothetical protein